MFLTASSAQVFLKKSGRTNKQGATSSNALWEVDIVHEKATYGGMGAWRSQFRFKHLSSEKYLSMVR